MKDKNCRSKKWVNKKKTCRLIQRAGYTKRREIT